MLSAAPQLLTFTENRPNGIFLLREREAEIVDTVRIAENDLTLKGVKFATQSGPMMIQSGKINTIFTFGSDNRLVRNAVCVTSPHHVTLALSRGPINFYDFARFLRDRIGCKDALYLDGNVSRMSLGTGFDVGPDISVMIAVTQKIP